MPPEHNHRLRVSLASGPSKTRKGHGHTDLWPGGNSALRAGMGFSRWMDTGQGLGEGLWWKGSPGFSPKPPPGALPSHGIWEGGGQPRRVCLGTLLSCKPPFSWSQRWLCFSSAKSGALPISTSAPLPAPESARIPQRPPALLHSPWLGGGGRGCPLELRRRVSPSFRPGRRLAGGGCLPTGPSLAAGSGRPRGGRQPGQLSQP